VLLRGQYREGRFQRLEIDLPVRAPEGLKPLQKVLTPDQRTVDDVTRFLGVEAKDLVKTLLFETDRGSIAALVRGDHEISEKKLKAVVGAENLQMASEGVVEAITRAPKGFAGLLGSRFP